jgi:WD40 repeat protein
VLSVGFSPDGKTLASASGDKTVILWDVGTRQQLGSPLIGHKGDVWSAAFSPDGKMLVSGGNDETVILWDVSLESWKARACSIANRNLTMDEWRTHFGPDSPYRRTCYNLPSGEGAPSDASPASR